MKKNEKKKNIYAVNIRKLFPCNTYADHYVEVFTHEKYYKSNCYPEPIAREIYKTTKKCIDQPFQEQFASVFKEV